MKIDYLLIQVEMPDEEATKLLADLVDRGQRYRALVKSQTMAFRTQYSAAERSEAKYLDEARRTCHNGLIDAYTILSRYILKTTGVPFSLNRVMPITAHRANIGDLVLSLANAARSENEAEFIKEVSEFGVGQDGKARPNDVRCFR